MKKRPKIAKATENSTIKPFPGEGCKGHRKKYRKWQNQTEK